MSRSSCARVRLDCCRPFERCTIYGHPRESHLEQEEWRGHQKIIYTLLYMDDVSPLLSQRQVVDKRVWKELKAFFPPAKAFRVETPECLQCLGESVSERAAEEAVKRNREQEISLPVLKALYSRKIGVSEFISRCIEVSTENYSSLFRDGSMLISEKCCKSGYQRH